MHARLPPPPPPYMPAGAITASTRGAFVPELVPMSADVYRSSGGRTLARPLSPGAAGEAGLGEGAGRDAAFGELARNRAALRGEGLCGSSGGRGVKGVERRTRLVMRCVEDRFDPT